MTCIVYSFIEKKPASILFGQGKTNLLVSYYHLKSWSKKRLVDFFEYIKDERCKHNNPGVFMLDSGAYSAWTKNKSILLDDYINFVKEYHSYFTHIICLDVIGDPVLSEVNHLIMLEELKDFNLTIIPVFHGGEPFAVLDYMVRKDYKYIGISPSNQWREKEKTEWLSRVFSRYDFEQLGIKTHGFGYQSRGLVHFPLTTSDAVSWRMASCYGRLINPFGSSVGVSENAKRYSGHVDSIGGYPQFVIDFCNELNIEPDALRDSQDLRDIFNIKALDVLGKLEKKDLSFQVDIFDSGSFDEDEVTRRLKG